jgi:hypothetical protein
VKAVVLTDHDSRVLARRRVKTKASELGPVLAWARQQARRHGFDDVTIGCEPTVHRWRVLDQFAAQQDMRLVCVQPLLVGRAREREDYTHDKTDLLTELSASSRRGCVRRRARLARFAAREQRCGFAAGVVRTGGAAAGFAGGDRRAVRAVSAG